MKNAEEILNLKKLMRCSDSQLLDIAVAYEDGRKMDAIRLLRATSDGFEDIGYAAKTIKKIYELLSS